jgi:GntP family gluconate:H+ symporter
MIYLTLLLAGSIAAIILLSSRYRFNTFFVLLLVALATGLIAGLDGETLLNALRAGFGGTLQKIGLLIVLGAALGALLDRSHATLSLARYLLAKTGKANAPLATGLIGFTVGMPIFCDSAFVVLSGLVLMLSQQTKGMHLRLVTGLATALFAVHCLAPPHPGISAAAGTLGVDLGQAMLAGALVAIPPIVVAWFWVRRQSRLPEWQALAPELPADTVPAGPGRLPSPLASFLPILIPIGLIALKSLMVFLPTGIPAGVMATIRFLGDPVAALLTGIVLSLFLFEKWDKAVVNTLLDSAIEKSGPILAITAAGGAFGEVIKTLDPGAVYGARLVSSSYIIAPIEYTSARASSTSLRACSGGM